MEPSAKIILARFKMIVKYAKIALNSLTKSFLHF